MSDWESGDAGGRSRAGHGLQEAGGLGQAELDRHGGQGLRLPRVPVPSAQKEGAPREGQLFLSRLCRSIPSSCQSCASLGTTGRHCHMSLPQRRHVPMTIPCTSQCGMGYNAHNARCDVAMPSGDTDGDAWYMPFAYEIYHAL